MAHPCNPAGPPARLCESACALVMDPPPTWRPPPAAPVRLVLRAPPCATRRSRAHAAATALEFGSSGQVGKTSVVGAKKPTTKKATANRTLQGFVKKHATKSAKFYSDDAGAYDSLPFSHVIVKYSLEESGGATFTPTASSRCGPCSSGRTRARSTS